MPFTKAQHVEFARRVREGGLDARIAIQKEIEEARRARPGYDGLGPPPRTDVLTFTRENHRQKFVHRIASSDDDDRAALLRFAGRSQ